MGNTIGAGRATRPATVKVWDPLVRIFHWSLVATFVIAYATGDPSVPREPALPDHTSDSFCPAMWLLTGYLSSADVLLREALVLFFFQFNGTRLIEYTEATGVPIRRPPQVPLCLKSLHPFQQHWSVSASCHSQRSPRHRQAYCRHFLSSTMVSDGRSRRTANRSR